jgi:uncharacterized protein (DUF983 family)
MDGKAEGRKRRPSIEVRCPECGTRTVWHRLPGAGDVCRWCGHAFGDFEWHTVKGVRGGRGAE